MLLASTILTGTSAFAINEFVSYTVSEQKWGVMEISVSAILNPEARPLGRVVAFVVSLDLRILTKVESIGSSGRVTVP